MPGTIDLISTGSWLPDDAYWSVAPFVLLLAAIAILPLILEHFWHSNRNKGLVAAVLAIPVVVYLYSLDARTIEYRLPEAIGPGENLVLGEWKIQQGDHVHIEQEVAVLTGARDDLLRISLHSSGDGIVAERHGQPGEVLNPGSAVIALQGQSTHALIHELEQYASFIILLASLYVVAGGIVLRGDLQGKPLTNTGFLALGAVLANLIGTTGASMVLIRPVLRINQHRRHTRHLPVFFIFTVSNLGGLLTPLGDPPLFLGFLNGVDFFWTMRLLPHFLLANGLVLTVFLIWDSWAYRRETTSTAVRDPGPLEPLRVEGLINLVYLGGILLAVLLQSERVVGEDWVLVRPGGEVLMVSMALASLISTPTELRRANRFAWPPIVEVAVLFAGIFVAMVPALEMIKLHREGFGITEPWQYFWITGTLSSFLDNAPTYLTFANLAAGSNHFGQLASERPLILEAISCGAVFMGANTYIGNGPNFMVKAIADESGIRAPSFLGYMAYSSLILLPIFGLITIVFF
jgi:Na+/H+ antiporter NhaD/arsenite permease-like protein